METFGILVFLGISVLGLCLVATKENKREKRIWDWRERLIESINHNSESIDDVVKALMYEK